MTAKTNISVTRAARSPANRGGADGLGLKCLQACSSSYTLSRVFLRGSSVYSLLPYSTVSLPFPTAFISTEDSGIDGRHGGGTEVRVDIVWLFVGPLLLRAGCEYRKVVFRVNETLTEIRNAARQERFPSTECGGVRCDSSWRQARSTTQVLGRHHSTEGPLILPSQTQSTPASSPPA